ncbi:hypothetical protein [Clostridium minihomine]|uniref:hypothetical protein n=1 Tax=Clostridium minihomine TaxID=2045012 RepID=UPI000C782D5B|nr:hypothetical protein [Clostridium minihomine]
MKQIINGKLYNTETATLICKFPVADIYVGNDIDYCYFIYRKDNGEFFAQYIRFDDFDNNLQYLEPLTFDRAARLSESLMGVDEYVEVFGEVEE